MRIIVGGFQHETNTFATSKAGMDAFERGGGWPALVTGDAMFPALEGTNFPAAGFIAAAHAHGHDIIPTLWCAASPSAHVTQDAYETIAARLLEQIQAALPADALFLDLHGAMVCEHLEDGEGELLERVRNIVGEALPVVVSLDLHANVSTRMLELADMLVAFRTYPHVDRAETGVRAFEYLQRRLDGMPRQPVWWRRQPYLIPLCWQSTFLEPARTLYERLGALENQPGVGSLSWCMGFPAADIADCGGMLWGYGEEDAGRAAVDALAQAIVDAEAEFAGTLHTPEAAVQEAQLLSSCSGQPVIIADAQDNPGAGSDSDTTGLLRALIAAGVEQAAIGLIVDGESAAAAHAAGVGATVRLALGGKSGVAGDAPLVADYEVETLSDGRFLAQGPFYRGVHMALGPSACLRLGGVRIVVTTNKAQMADRGMFRFVGITPEAARILVVKSSVHFRADFQPIASHVLVAAAPGSMEMDPAQLPWTRLSDTLRLRPCGPTLPQWRAQATNNPQESH